MSAQFGETHRLDRVKGAKAVPATPYASRGAGLYSEVSWDPIGSLRSRTARTSDSDGERRPASPSGALDKT